MGWWAGRVLVARIVSELDKRTGKLLAETDKERAGERAEERADERLRRLTPVQLAALEEKTARTEAVALDCEMVAGVSGAECLARVCLVNQMGQPLYYRCVVPEEPVADYRSHITGLSPELLTEQVGAVRFAEAQRRVAELLRGRTLVGHALKNDLKVLLLSHPHRAVRDTARYKLMREAGRGGTPSLKSLAARLLGREVQKGAHDPLQDARVAMQLYMSYRDNWERDVSSTWTNTPGSARSPRGRPAARGGGDSTSRAAKERRKERRSVGLSRASAP